MPVDQRISELIQRTPNGQEYFEVIIPPFTPGTNRKVLLSDLSALFGGGGGTVTSVTGTTSRVAVDNTNPATPVINIDAAYDAAVTAVINAKVADAINDGTTTIAPSQNAVFDALALKLAIADRVLGLAFSDEVTPITGTPDKLTFHFPYTTTTLEVWAELKTAQASGNIFTVDVHKNGTTILSTKITIDNTEETSLTAAAQPVISVSAITKGDKVTIDVDQVGNGTAIGGKIWFRG